MHPEKKILPDGTEVWRLPNEKLHRVDGPAYIGHDGHQAWYMNGKSHREDGPALIYPDGSEVWYLNDKIHRVDGPAATWPDGSIYWYLNGKLHREDGPTITCPDGREEWYIDGERINSKNYGSPRFKNRWKKLVDLYHIKKILES